MASSNLCAYLLNIYYLHITNSAEFKNFTSTYNRNDISYSKWIKKRKSIYGSIRRASAFRSGGDCSAQTRFNSYFTLANFIKFSDEVRQKHTYDNCKECFTNHKEHFLLLKRNDSTKFAVQDEVEVPGTPDAG